MKASPILFSGPMVRAILAGQKTQTRRAMKSQPIIRGDNDMPRITQQNLCTKPENWGRWQMGHEDAGSYAHFDCPYGKPGSLLWVRETFVIESDAEYHGDNMPKDKRPILRENERNLIPHYRATEPEPHIVEYDAMDSDDDRTRWKPSIFMPKWASRLTLEITNVRVEQLHDISPADITAEGCHVNLKFSEIWEALNGNWASNPWVWVIEFKPHLQNILLFDKAAPAGHYIFNNNREQPQ